MRQQYRLESITLRDVGVFEHTHFDFPQIKSEEKDAEKAEIHIFTGPNGCGKSTLLYALAAVFQPDPNDGGRLVRKRYRGENSSIRFIFTKSRAYLVCKIWHLLILFSKYTILIVSTMR